MTTLVVLLSLGAGFLFASWLNVRKRRGVHYAVVYNGTTWVGGLCQVVPEGISFDKVRYQAPLTWPIAIAPGVTVWIVPVERVALALHQQLEVARRTAKPTMLFKGGGDILFLMQLLSAMIPIAVCLYFVLSLGGLEGRITALAVEVAKANDVLSQPLQVQPSNNDLPRLDP